MFRLTIKGQQPVVLPSSKELDDAIRGVEQSQITIEYYEPGLGWVVS